MPHTPRYLLPASQVIGPPVPASQVESDDDSMDLVTGGPAGPGFATAAFNGTFANDFAAFNVHSGNG